MDKTSSLTTDLSESQKEEAIDAVSQIADGSVIQLSNEEVNLFKQHFLNDSYDLTKFICKHRDLVDSYHRPLSYLATHSTEKLASLLLRDEYPSYVLEQIREECHEKGVFEDDPDFVRKLDYAIDFVNLRLFRGSFKSSVVTHGGNVHILTKYPNFTNALMASGDDPAIEFNSQIRETLRSDIYQQLFPERVPKPESGKLADLWTQSRLFMGGRTISHPQWNIEAQGFLSEWTRMHFNRLNTDDIVGERTLESELPEIERRLKGISGLYMLKKRIWRVHVGTVWYPADDHYHLKKIDKMFTIEVPIEIFPEGQPDDLTVRGIPTCPELFETEGISAEEAITNLQNEIYSKDETGAGEAAWSRNYLLNAGLGGAVVFPPHLISMSKYLARGETNEGYEVGVPKKNKFGEYLYEDPEKRYLAREWQKLHAGGFAFYFGVDPAFSTSNSADDWAIAVIAVDPSGRYFVPAVYRGKGWHNLVDRLCEKAPLWNVRKIGFEKQTAQEVINDAMKWNPKFRRIARLIELFTTGNKSKEDRIRALVASNMAAGRMFLNPKEYDLLKEMEFYVPGPNAKDNQLDAIAYGVMVARGKPAAPKDTKGMSAWQRHKRHRENRYKVRLYRNI